MAEFTGDTYIEYETDIEIDFSKLSTIEKTKLITSIRKSKKYIFKDVCVEYDGEVTIDVEPREWE